MAKCRRREVYGVEQYMAEDGMENVTPNETGNGVLNCGHGLGTKLVVSGDFVITNPDGSRDVVKQEEFRKLFEFVSEKTPVAAAAPTPEAPKAPAAPKTGKPKKPKTT